MTVRVRGIYATAITRVLLDAGCEIVQASDPIRERFEDTFDVVDHDVAVETTDDRQGVAVEGIAGPGEDVRGTVKPPSDQREEASATVPEIVATLSAVGLDAFAWESAAPRGAVFDGRVVDTGGSGATVDLGDASGFLPFGNVDGYVEEGDAVRVQVLESEPPWTSREPLLDADETDLLAPGGLASLLRGRDGDVVVDGGDRADSQELVGFTELLDVDLPAGWGIQWQPEAIDAGVEAMDAALRRAVDAADAIDAALDGAVGDEPRQLVSPMATTHVWFGRSARFGLDERRREVTTTMPGHHRTKAATSAASAGVDLAEALCEPGGEFPFGVVTRQFGPVEGDSVRIAHGKPDGRVIVLGEGDVVDYDPEGSVTVSREMSPGGSYDELPAQREAGDVALTTFREGRWWYPTVYRDRDGARKGTYVNVCTPVEIFPNTIRYVDLHIDVVKHSDGTVKRVDDDDLDAAVETGDVTEPLAEKARSVAASLETALRE